MANVSYILSLHFISFLSPLLNSPSHSLSRQLCSPENPIPTNILKLTMAIEQEDTEGMQQVIFYDSGVGTQGAVDKIMGGGFGEGIDINIKELYTFLVLNYDDGDEVLLFGFSRGSYTVRSLCGLIYEAGLVRRDQIQFVKEAYDLYRNNVDVESPEAVAFREAHGDRIPIKLLVCFDTVGSLGLPFEGPAFLSKFNADQYRFHSTTLNPLIEHAIHMLAIDEDRQGKLSFLPPYSPHYASILRFIVI